MKIKPAYFWLLLLLPLVFIGWYLVEGTKDKPLRYLPYFGPKHATKVDDTTYHKVSAFTFTNQYNELTSLESLKNKIYVTEFFFTTCQSICPVMNRHLDQVYALYKNDPEVLILSHTVDPETDSVKVLKDYAGQHGVINRNWLFVTGTKSELYSMARKAYLLDAGEGNAGAEDFVHTQNFALVDKDQHIRGYYDGTDSLEVQRLIREIELLKKEHAYRAADH